jgi:hypothetical protein
LREDAQKLKEEKTTLEVMIMSHDELIMEMAEEYGLNHMGEIIEEEAPVEMVPEQEAPMAHEVILADAEPESPHHHLFNMIMRDYEESPPRMENGPHELDDLDDL